MKIKTILVPLDGSTLAEGALSPAVDLARDYGSRLVLMRAAEAHATPMADPTKAQVEVVRSAESYLADARDRVTRAGVAGVEVSVWYAPPAEAIVDAARMRGADLIVMSSHGRSGLGRIVLGSVAETVLRSTEVPVLLIRPGRAVIDAPYAPSAGDGAARV